MLNDKEEILKTEIAKLKKMLAILPKHKEEELKSELSVYFGFDFMDLLKMEEELSKDTAPFVPLPPYSFFNDFGAQEVDHSSKVKKSEPGFEKKLEKSATSEEMEKLGSELEDIVESVDFDNLLITIAKATHKMYMSYRAVGFSKDEAMLLVVNSQTSMDPKNMF